jgi:Ser/Thr protein kinase RdoA (MazF antagonist)
MEETLQSILKNYPLPEGQWTTKPFGTGLINHTWQISCESREEKYILQKINVSVFKQPQHIAENIASIGHYLSLHDPEYIFVQPLETKSGQLIVQLPEDGSYRLTPFVAGSHTVDTVTNVNQAYEASKQFGKFTSRLNQYPVQDLKITLPDFHNLAFRNEQFDNALHTAPNSLLKYCSDEIKILQQYRFITDTYYKLKREKSIPQRVIHHDTKISNCLFDATEKGICVIDLDTVMPGYFISDVGDMCRSYLCPLNEESVAFDEIAIRLEYFDALAEGYLSEMSAVLTANEIALFTYSGKFLMYMQALRFLADFLKGDPYYPVSHPLHNLDRTKNQIALLNAYCNMEPDMEKIVLKHMGKKNAYYIPKAV